MFLNKNISVLTLQTVLLFLFLPTIAVWSQQNPLTQAIQQFDAGNYTHAEILLKTILQDKPDDFMVNYFYGACRTENGFYSNTDLKVLEKASREVSPVKINLYLGMQNQALENWGNALKNYNRYLAKANLEEPEKTEIAQKIEQCYNKENPYKSKVIDDYILFIPKDSILPEPEQDTTSLGVETVEPDTVIVAESNTIIDSTILIPAPIVPSPPKKEIKTETPKIETIYFIVNRSIYYLVEANFQTEEGKSAFLETKKKQQELDYALQKAEELRAEYAVLKTREEKQNAGKEILKYEDRIYILNTEITELAAQAKKLENEYWENASAKEKREFLLEIEQIEHKIQANSKNKDFIDPNILLGNTPVEQVVNDLGGDELIYKIQIGAYSRGLPSYVKRLFNKLSLIRKIENYTDENGVTVYTTGNLSNLEDAERMKNQVRQEGVEDAYVVPYFNGKRITLAQAKEIIGDK